MSASADVLCVAVHTHEYGVDVKLFRYIGALPIPAEVEDRIPEELHMDFEPDRSETLEIYPFNNDELATVLENSLPVII